MALGRLSRMAKLKRGAKEVAGRVKKSKAYGKAKKMGKSAMKKAGKRPKTSMAIAGGAGAVGGYAVGRKRRRR